MRAQLFGIEHILYIIITSIILVVIELVKNKQKKESNLIYEKM